MVIAYPVCSVSAKEKHRSAPQKFTVTGDISGMPAQSVILENIRANDSISTTDSLLSTDNGHFEFNGTVTEPSIYRLRLKDNKYILLAIEKGTVHITGQWPLPDYQVEGSAASVALKIFLDNLRGYILTVNKAYARIDSIKGTGNTALALSESEAATKLKDGFMKQMKQYADTSGSQPNAVFAARMLNPKDDIAYLVTFGKVLEKKWPGTQMTKDFNDFILKTKELLPESTDVGSKAPELKLNDMDGKPVSLSSFKGKFVLIDFWASWCGPCRGENPNVVAAYNKYRDKNFTILGVSLDKDKEPWVKAVNKDGLNWTQVSDLKGWSSGAAAKYGVQSIPANFLINPEGVIIAKGLRGPDLESKLEAVLK